MFPVIGCYTIINPFDVPYLFLKFGPMFTGHPVFYANISSISAEFQFFESAKNTLMLFLEVFKFKAVLAIISKAVFITRQTYCK